MKIKTISYQKMFPLMPYINERLGIEIELDDTDKVDNAYQLAKELVEAHRTPIQPSQTEAIIAPIKPEENYTTHIPKPSVNKREALIQQYKNDIATVKEEKVLEIYFSLAKNYPEIKQACDDKLKELTKTI